MARNHTKLLQLASTTPFFITTIVGACFLFYGNAIGNGFVYDDIPQVVNNPWIKDFSYIPVIFTSSVWAFCGVETNYYRPLMHIVYLVTYQLFGLKPWAFHLVNILVHTANSVLVFCIARRLLAKSERSGTPTDMFLPFLAALLFAAHPVHTEVVTWVGGVTDVTFSFFSLLSFYFFIHYDEYNPLLSACFIMAVVSYFLATLCKEPAVTFPLILVAYDYSFNDTKFTFSRYLKRYIPFLAAALIYVILRLSALQALAPLHKHADLSMAQAVINVLPLFASYLGTLLLPVNLNAWHVFHPISSLFVPRGIVSLCVALGFIAAVILTAKKRKPLFFSLLFIIIPLLPALYLPALGENAFAERYLYFSSVGFVLLLPFLAGSLSPKARKLACYACLVVIFLYATGTVLRNPVWKDDYTFWRDVVKKSPEGAVPHYNLGAALAALGRYDEAIEEYKRAISLKPAPVAFRSLAAALYAKGTKAEAIKAYLEAIRLQPGDAALYNELGTLYGEVGMTEKAIEQLEIAVRLLPNDANFHYNLGIAYRDKGLNDKARDEFKAAVMLNPSDAAFKAMLDSVSR
jgi:tetratricopeptide (TPR) repeat protein